MTNDFSEKPIEGEEAAKFRRMHHEWREFRDGDKRELGKVAWAIRNWRVLGLLVIIGAAGSAKNLLETIRAWLS